MYVSLLFNIYYKIIFKNIEYHSENVVLVGVFNVFESFFILNRAAFIWSKHTVKAVKLWNTTTI